MKRVLVTVLVIISVLAGIAVWTPASVLNLVARGGDVIIERDIPFGTDARLRLDIYKPASARGQMPVIVFFYGGSWQRGERSIYRFVGASLARAGMIVVVPDYRLHPPVLYPDFLRDSALAVRWAKENAARFGGDPARLFVSGHSAGAYNAVSLATDRRWLEEVKLDPKSDLAGVIGIAGPYDFLPLTDEQLKIIFGPEETRPNTQPINYVEGNEPPLLLLRPSGDTVVDPGNSTRLAKRIEDKGGNATVITYDRVGHLSIVGTLSPLLSFLAPVKNDLTDFVRNTAPTGGVEMIVVSLISVAIFLSAWMAFAWWLQKQTGQSGWIDTLWSYGVGIAGVALAIFVPLGATDETSVRQLLVAALCGLWSVRLGTHILFRTLKGGDDPRYAQLKKEWRKSAQSKLFWFLQIQALCAFVLALAVFVAAQNPAPGLRALDWAGAALLLFSIAGEGVADRQLKTFVADKANRGKVAEVGLWAYSRHPNYFFEWLGWFAYVLIATNLTGTYWWWLLALLAPAMMYWLLVHASGIPPLEEHMLRSRGAKFRDYQRRVNAFFPGPRRALHGAKEKVGRS